MSVVPLQKDAAPSSPLIASLATLLKSENSTFAVKIVNCWMLFEISHMSNRILAILNIIGAISRHGKKLLQIGTVKRFTPKIYSPNHLVPEQFAPKATAPGSVAVI